MGFVVQFGFLFVMGLCSVVVCCGALVFLLRVIPLVQRQRAALEGVGK